MGASRPWPALGTFGFGVPCAPTLILWELLMSELGAARK